MQARPRQRIRADALILDLKDFVAPLRGCEINP